MQNEKTSRAVVESVDALNRKFTISVDPQPGKGWNIQVKSDRGEEASFFCLQQAKDDALYPQIAAVFETLPRDLDADKAAWNSHCCCIFDFDEEHAIVEAALEDRWYQLLKTKDGVLATVSAQPRILELLEGDRYQSIYGTDAPVVPLLHTLPLVPYLYEPETLEQHSAIETYLDDIADEDEREALREELMVLDDMLEEEQFRLST